MENSKVIEHAFEPDLMPYRETVYTIGNGYLGTRGTFEEGYPGTDPVTLIHGVFNDQAIVHTELVNAPSWIDFHIVIGGDRFRMDQGELLGYHRELDLRTGVLSRSVLWRSPGGRTVQLLFERFASLASPHIMAVRCRVTSIDFSAEVELRAGISAIVDNAGYRHWQLLDQGPVDPQSVLVQVRTSATKLLVSETATLVVSAPGFRYSMQDCVWAPTILALGQLAPGQSLVADKFVAIYTSRETDNPSDSAIAALAEARDAGYEALLEAQTTAWAELWDRADIIIEGDDEADLAVRYNLFQLSIAAPRFEERVSIPAKTLSGYGYRGHVFWDTEIFMLPFFTYTQPSIARNMLEYRYWTLPGARHKAAKDGFEGAMYAWESAATGAETTPRWIPTWMQDRDEGELIRIWCGDIELHITADVAYAVHQYWRVTGDDDFMRYYGAEILLETARFWASRAEWNEELGIYEIRDVIGPDENHDHVDNNAYTNGMARWNLEVALEVVEWLRANHTAQGDELLGGLGLTDARLDQWRTVIEGLHIGFDPGTGLIEQFTGFYELQEVLFQDYEPRTTSLQAILGVEETQRRQILKQPDVLMLLYLLEDAYDEDVLQANWSYYTPKTDVTYGSSLGPAIQAALAARMGDIEQAYHFFQLAARTDLLDNRGNTSEGIHGATAGGLWQATVFGFGGVRLTPTGPVAEPRLPAGWTRLAFNLCYRGNWLEFDLRATV
jgi:trehalose/maltose hydrolase-like predicted phosphorylase